MELKQIAFLVTSIAAFVLLAAAAGGPSWTKTSIKIRNIDINTNVGIFRQCIENPITGDTECDNLTIDQMKNQSSKLNAIRAFAILAVLTSLFGAVFSLIGLFTSKVKGIVGAVFLFIAAVCALIAASIFTDETREAIEEFDGLSYGWSFAFEWVGMIVSAVAGILGVVSN